ncbi:MAG: hypothetical protein QME47_05905 [Candidatus Thermoplasmatota archaeon]|nr:hypothetical protein [Candidatus Thermoplasmatota archaeon]
MVEVVQQISCPSCGAPVKVVPGEIIITCEYCGSDMKLGEKFFLKHSIIPGRYKSEDVVEIVKKWMGGGFYKPDDLAKRSIIKSVECVFLPFFIVHLEALTRYSGFFTRTGENIPKNGELKKEYFWKVLGRRSSEFPTKEYHIPLSGKTQFNLAHISKNAKFLNSEIDEKEAENIARQEVGMHQKYLLEDTIDLFSSLDTDCKIIDTELVHAPVWFIDYDYKKHIYKILVDGASGETIKGGIPLPDTSFKGLFKEMKRGLFSRG